MSSPIAYLLITHGSRNPQSTVSAKFLLDNLQPYLPHAQLFHGQLEGSEFPLHQQILTLADQLRSCSIYQLHLLPLFLIPGVHILEDLPQELTIARQTLNSDCQIILHPYLGEQLQQHPNLFPETTATARILLTHGSKRPGSLTAIDTLAQTLNAIPAYYATTPDLLTQLQQLTDRGHTEIQILNHFLFPGTITEKLQTTIDSYQTDHPDQIITLTETLDRLPQFPSLLAKILETSTHAAL